MKLGIVNGHLIITMKYLSIRSFTRSNIHISIKLTTIFNKGPKLGIDCLHFLNICFEAFIIIITRFIIFIFIIGNSVTIIIIIVPVIDSVAVIVTTVLPAISFCFDFTFHIKVRRLPPGNLSSSHLNP